MSAPCVLAMRSVNRTAQSLKDSFSNCVIDLVRRAAENGSFSRSCLRIYLETLSDLSNPSYVCLLSLHR